MKKTALVTGGAGFIGSHLCQKLLDNNFEVISLDNYFTGSKENEIAGVKYVDGHTKDIEKLIEENKIEKINIVYHLGEYSRVAESINEPEVVLDLNLTGTFNVLEFCRKRNIKIIYAGSSTKYAHGTIDDSVDGADLSPYTWSKAINTDLVEKYGKWYGLEYAIFYFYNVYGERERAGKYGTVVQIFLEKYLNNEPLLMSLPGTQTRIYTHINDAVEAIYLVGENGTGDGYGISAEESFSVIELIELFPGAKVETRPPRATSRKESIVNNEKVKALGWKQKHNLKDYISKKISKK